MNVFVSTSVKSPVEHYDAGYRARDLLVRRGFQQAASFRARRAREKQLHTEDQEPAG